MNGAQDSADGGSGNPESPDPTGEDTLAERSAAAIQIHIDAMVSADSLTWTDHASSLDRWKQGNMLRAMPASWIAPPGSDPFTGMNQALEDESPQWLTGTTDVIICSQTCDIGAEPPGDKHPFVVVAPVIHQSAIGSNSLRKMAAAGRLDNLIPVLPPAADALAAMYTAYDDQLQRREERERQQGKEPSVRTPFTTARDAPDGHRWYADLRLLMPASKAVLLGRGPIEAFPSETEHLMFSEVLAQKFRRPALHDAFSRAIPEIIDDFIRQTNPRRQCIAKVEQVRVHVTEGTLLYPGRAQLLVITGNGVLNTDEQAAWDELDQRVANALSASGTGLTYVPLVHYDISDLKASLYRQTVPLRCKQLGHNRWP